MSWKIRHIFDGEYGCEELKPGEKPKVSVTLVNENREEWIVSVEDEWLIGHGLEEGDVWPEFLRANKTACAKNEPLRESGSGSVCSSLDSNRKWNESLFVSFLFRIF